MRSEWEWKPSLHSFLFSCCFIRSHIQGKAHYLWLSFLVRVVCSHFLLGIVCLSVSGKGLVPLDVCLVWLLSDPQRPTMELWLPLISMTCSELTTHTLWKRTTARQGGIWLRLSIPLAVWAAIQPWQLQTQPLSVAHHSSHQSPALLLEFSNVT